MLQGKILIYYPLAFLLALGLLLRRGLYLLWEMNWMEDSNLSDWLYSQDKTKASYRAALEPPGTSPGSTLHSSSSKDQELD